MREIAIETLAELLGLLAYTLLSAGFTAEGLLVEQRGLTQLAGGHDLLGLWFVYMGSLALYAGVYLFGYRELLPRILTGWRRLYEARWQ